MQRDWKRPSPLSRETLSRREFLAGAAAVGATIVLPGELAAAADGKKTFTILHTNDMHASFIGMGPASDYTPFTLNDDTTRGGYARLAGLIAKRKEARKGQGPVLVLDAGDYSMGTAFSAATRETGGELHLMGLMGYDATTFGNHEFDLGPAGLGKSIGAAVKAGRIPAVLAANTSFAGSDATLADLQRLAKDGVVRRYAGDRARRHALRSVRDARQGGHDLYQRRSHDLRRPHRVRQGGGEDPAREGEGGCGHRAQPRRRGEGQGRALHRRRGRASGQGRAGHRRGDRRPQPHRAAGGDHRQRPHAGGPDRQGEPQSRRTGDHAGRGQADGRVVPAPSDRRHHRRRPRPSPPRSKSSRSRSPQPRSRRAATASTSRWPSRRAICPIRTPTSPPERSWPTSSPTRFAKRRRPTSGSPPTA